MPSRTSSHASRTSWVVLVEGASDRIAVETLATRRGRDLVAEGIDVIAIGGAQAIGRHLASLPADVRVAGLCDAGEEAAFRRALERAGLARAPERLEALLAFVRPE